MPGINTLLPEINTINLDGPPREDEYTSLLNWNRRDIDRLKRAIATLEYMQNHPPLSKTKQNILGVTALLLSLATAGVSGYFFVNGEDYKETIDSNTMALLSMIGSLSSATGTALSLRSLLITNYPRLVRDSPLCKFENDVLPICLRYEIPLTAELETTELLQILNNKLQEEIGKNKELGGNYAFEMNLSKHHSSFWGGIKKLWGGHKRDENEPALQRTNSRV